MSMLNHILTTCASGKSIELYRNSILHSCFNGEDWAEQVKRWAKDHNLHVRFNEEADSCTFYPPSRSHPLA